MTILKRLILCLTITPLAISIAFAIGGNDPIGGIDIIIKKPIERRAIVKKPVIAKELRTIKQRDTKFMKSSVRNEVPRHDENVSRCYTQQQNNVMSIDDIDGCVGIASDSTF